MLAMFLLEKEFSQEEKRRNFDYYDPSDHRRFIPFRMHTGNNGRPRSVVWTRPMEYTEIRGLHGSCETWGRNTEDGCHIAAPWEEPGCCSCSVLQDWPICGKEPNFTPESAGRNSAGSTFSISILKKPHGSGHNPQRKQRYTLKKGDRIASFPRGKRIRPVAGKSGVYNRKPENPLRLCSKRGS